ncbi:MAG: Fur family transcriptional regulator [bacterium]
MKPSIPRKHSIRRERILELLSGTKQHPTAEWVYEQLKREYPGLSLGTVYRNLRILVEEGLAQSIPGGKSTDHFDADIAPHHHVTCDRCGRVSDAPVKVAEELFRKMEQVTGYRIDYPQISVSGLCPDCQIEK